MARGEIAFTLGLIAALTAAPGDARAYCRSTTCQGDCPVDDDGCKTTGKPLAWASSCVGISLQKDASRYIPLDEARPAIVAAFTEWSLRDCDGEPATMGFVELEVAACNMPAFDLEGANANVVMFQDYKWGHASADNALAKTTVSYDTETGEILDADIELNAALNEITTSDVEIANDLSAILAHEVGHFIGLDHSLDGAAVMHAEHDAHDVMDRLLTADDVAAVCAAYPPSRAAPCDSAPHGGFTSACVAPATEDDGCTVTAPSSAPRGRGDAGAMLLALAVLGLIRRRR